MSRTNTARYDTACGFLPAKLRAFALQLDSDKKAFAEELRLRVGQPMSVLLPEGEQSKDAFGEVPSVTQEDLEGMLDYVTEYSRYIAADTIRQGYISLKGGYRLGVCARAVMQNGTVENMRDISSLALRIVREKTGLAEPLIPKIMEGQRLCSTLILSAPGGGKTTLLRDMIRTLSLGSDDRFAKRVAVVDERSEIAASFCGVPQMHIGNHTDVLDCCPKKIGIPLLLRAMNPQVIALDEITTEEDIYCTAQAAHCGVSLLATIHANSTEELSQKPLWQTLLHTRVFSRAVVIENSGGKRQYRVEVLD